jgi:hypothetical protein
VAIIALQNKKSSTMLASKEKLLSFSCQTKSTRCNGCENNCLLSIAVFFDEKTFYNRFFLLAIPKDLYTDLQQNLKSLK